MAAVGTVVADNEEARYDVVERDGDFEIRAYAPQVVAEVMIDDFADGGSDGFGRLFRYISGRNRARAEIAMTAPVGQEQRTEKIPMTAPVGQQKSGGKWAFSFMMPASYTLETAPQPEDPSITLREVPARRMAAIRYSGRWTEKKYLARKKALEAWMDGRGLAAAGEAIWARYNPPMTPPFLRRNEVLIPIALAP